MAWSNVRLEAILEMIVILFQVCGVVALGLTRLIPAARWVERGRVVFIIAMVGLGVAGALCGRQDSEFALFAGGTMTALLIGITVGNGATDPTRTPAARIAPEAMATA